LACELIEKARWREHLAGERQPLILHSDNGSPMKAATFLEKLYDLGVLRRHAAAPGSATTTPTPKRCSAR
tara:strand:- start:1526 stop:1735 length:210 start_codon:yes stop_codon:yes gene_type:complete